MPWLLRWIPQYQRSPDSNIRIHYFFREFPFSFQQRVSSAHLQVLSAQIFWLYISPVCCISAFTFPHMNTHAQFVPATFARPASQRGWRTVCPLSCNNGQTLTADQPNNQLKHFWAPAVFCQNLFHSRHAGGNSGSSQVKMTPCCWLPFLIKDGCISSSNEVGKGYVVSLACWFVG